MEKTISIGGKDVVFRATAYTPTLYRNSFPGQDIFRDFAKMGEASGTTDEEVLSSIDFSLGSTISFVPSKR